MRQKLIGAGVVFVILVGGLMGWRAYSNSHQVARIELPVGLTATLHPGVNEGDGHYPKPLGKSLKTLSSSTTLKLPKGGYRVVIDDPQNQYAINTFNLLLADQPVTLVINPDYSTDKLSQLLGSEEPAIRSVLQAKYPQVGAGYSIASGSLYKHGEWYAALLKPMDSTQDTYRVVLKKSSGTWQIVTDPPQILVSQVTHPDIPVDVISDVDNIKQ